MPTFLPSRDARPALLLVVAIGVVIRLLLLALGRTSLIDGFYLQGAAVVGSGGVLYDDFVHVAFPIVEWIYAPIAFASDRLAAASAVTGVAVIITAVGIARILSAVSSRVAAVVGGVAYLTAAPVIAFHGFERELWSALFVTLAGVVLLGPPTRGEASRGEAWRGRLGGLLLALALFAKLTAAIGVAVVLVELLLRKRTERALIAGATSLLAFFAATLLLFGQHGGEFGVDVFLFFFMKGEASSLHDRATTLATHVDVNLILGTIGMLAMVPLRARAGRFPALLLASWYAYYLLASPSFWDHNSIDLALPAAMITGWLVGRLLEHGRLIARTGLVALVVVAAVLEWRGVSTSQPLWYPHGFGGSSPAAMLDEAALLAAESGAEDLVVASNPGIALLAHRVSFIGDFELEPVARAALVESRERGVAAMLRRRGQGATLGVPSSVVPLADNSLLFLARRDAAIEAHIFPRLLDAISLREIDVLVIPPFPPLRSRLLSAGYHEETRPGAALYRAPR